MMHAPFLFMLAKFAFLHIRAQGQHHAQWPKPFHINR